MELKKNLDAYPEIYKPYGKSISEKNLKAGGFLKEIKIPGVHFIKLKCHYWSFNTNFGILNATHVGIFTAAF